MKSIGMLTKFTKCNFGLDITTKQLSLLNTPGSSGMGRSPTIELLKIMRFVSGPAQKLNYALINMTLHI